MDRLGESYDVADYLKRKGFAVKSVRGKELVLDCFFCNPPDTKGHLYINDDTTQFNCFKCGETGNIVSLMKYFGDKVMDGNLSDDDRKRIEEKKTAEEIWDVAADFYHKSMTDEVVDYLIKRGFQKSIIEKYKIGFARGGLRNHLLKKGYTIEQCKKAAVVNDNNKDYFYKRIIFPYKYNNKVVLLRGREFNSNSSKKFLSLKDYEIRLYNEEAIRKNEFVIIAEGELDCLMLLQNEFNNAVCIPGANSFKKEWIDKFDHCKIVYLALDADKSGKAGIERIAKMLGEKARIVQLPQGLDINDFFMQGNTAEDFQNLLNSAVSLFELKIYEIKDMPENIKRVELKNLISELVILDPFDLNHYKDIIIRNFNIGKREINEMIKMKKNKEHKENPETETQDIPAIELSDAEKQEAIILLKDPELLTRFLNDTEKIRFVGEDCNKLLLLLSMTSRKLDRPIDIIVKGPSSGGKNYGINNVALFIPEEDVQAYSELTPKSLYYRTDILKHKTLIIAERVGAEQSDYVLRTMQSEKELILSTVVKNPETGKNETKDIKVEGPMNIIESTTKHRIHDENETRSFDIFVDESEEQTKKIHQAQRMKYKGEDIDKEKITCPWKNAQRLLKKYKVIIPYVDQITFDTSTIRSRRDHERFLALIEVTTFLY
ncbi:MAG: toprim domain-containing protein, partial [Candidatus Lokiarchaeota archaeon]|nr:toprim domain-containing protein [Candidatus Lokiarchaeota archaeon]